MCHVQVELIFISAGSFSNHMLVTIVYIEHAAINHSARFFGAIGVCEVYGKLFHLLFAAGEEEH
jgi:hypothetical protein